MRISPHHNLTITILRRNQFSDLRLRAASPRRIVRAEHVHAANRAGITPPTDPCRSTPRGFPWDGAYPDAAPRGERSATEPADQTRSAGAGSANQIGGLIDLYA